GRERQQARQRGRRRQGGGPRRPRGRGGRVTAFRRQRGIALLLVLWAFMILGVLALDFGRYMRDDAMAAVNFADETQGYYVAVAAINRALLDAARVLTGGAAAGGGAGEH